MSGSKPGKATGKRVSGKGVRELSGQAVRDSRCPKNHERKEDQKDRNTWTAQGEGRVWEEE